MKTHAISLIGSRLQVWSNILPAFQPKLAEEREFKKALTAALDALRLCTNPPRGRMARHGVFAEQKRRKNADLENLLFYNIDRWLDVSTEWPILRFERQLQVPSPDAKFGNDPKYYFSYSIEPENKDAGFKHAVTASNPILEFGFYVPEHHFFVSAPTIWYLASSSLSELRTTGIPLEKGHYFALFIKISSGTKTLSVNVKPLIDGVIAAWHQYGGKKRPEVVGLLMEKLKKLNIPPTAETIKDCLLHQHGRILEKKICITPWQRSLMVHPDDHLCDACEIILQKDESCAGFKVAVEVKKII